MTTYTEALAGIGELSAYALANLAEGACDNEQARDFYTSTRDAWVEAVEYATEPGGSWALADLVRMAEGYSLPAAVETMMDEVADGAPGVYNFTRMMEAIGTGAYLDTSDLATGDEDMVTLAGYVLYDLARTLIAALWSELATADEDGDEDEEADL